MKLFPFLPLTIFSFEHVINLTILQKSLDHVYHHQNNLIGELLACGSKEDTEEKPIYTTIFYPNFTINRCHLFITKSDHSNNHIPIRSIYHT